MLDVLSKHVDRATAVKLAGMFPKELRKFWPAFIQEAARERQQAPLEREFCQSPSFPLSGGWRLRTAPLVGGAASRELHW